MEVVKAKWFNDAGSPVVLMVDDLDNLWFDLNANGHPRPGEDWGYWQDSPGSSFDFLKRNLLDRFPEVHVTFFTVVGSPLICEYDDGKCYRGSINHDDKVAGFFSRIHGSENMEIAYHGLTHGVIKDGQYLHEWLSFNSLDEAVRNIEDGQKICLEVFGKKLTGGKYPGYASNQYSDRSIDSTGFTWWCRDSNYDKFLAAGKNYAMLDVKTFGRNNIVDFPTTVIPHMLVKNPVLGLAQRIWRNPYKRVRLHLEEILKNNGIISIQEHAGALRGDGKRQRPNIIDDIPMLIYKFEFLKDKNVWHATCSEIADYYNAFTYSKIKAVDESGFNINCSENNIAGNWLTLLIGRKSPVKILAPSGQIYKALDHTRRKGWSLANIKLEEGHFRLI